MADLDLQCQICSASFRPGVLNEKGKCPACEKQYPEAKNKLEAMSLNKPELHLHEALTEERVRAIVREELERDRSGKTEKPDKTQEPIVSGRLKEIAKGGK